MVDIFFCGFVDLADWFLVGRVDGLKSLSILTFDELVVDETAITRFSVRSRRFGGGADMSKDLRCGVHAMTAQGSPQVVCFDVKKARMAERLTVQWVAHICLMQAFLG